LPTKAPEVDLTNSIIFIVKFFKIFDKKLAFCCDEIDADSTIPVFFGTMKPNSFNSVVLNRFPSRFVSACQLRYD
jgi:hypothetical protein